MCVLHLPPHSVLEGVCKRESLARFHPQPCIMRSTRSAYVKTAYNIRTQERMHNSGVQVEIDSSTPFSSCLPADFPSLNSFLLAPLTRVFSFSPSTCTHDPSLTSVSAFPSRYGHRCFRGSRLLPSLSDTSVCRHEIYIKCRT